MVPGQPGADIHGFPMYRISYSNENFFVTAGKMTYLEFFSKDRPKIADLKRSRVPLNGYRRNPGEINYTSRNVFFPKNEKQKKLFHFFDFKNIFSRRKFLLRKSLIKSTFLEIYFWENHDFSIFPKMSILLRIS